MEAEKRNRKKKKEKKKASKQKTIKEKAWKAISIWWSRRTLNSPPFRNTSKQLHIEQLLLKLT